MSVETSFQHDFRFTTDLIQVREDGRVGYGCPCVVQKSGEDQIDIIINPEGQEKVVCIAFNEAGQLTVELRGSDRTSTLLSLLVVFDEQASQWKVDQ